VSFLMRYLVHNLPGFLYDRVAAKAVRK